MIKTERNRNENIEEPLLSSSSINNNLNSKIKLEKIVKNVLYLPKINEVSKNDMFTTKNNLSIIKPKSLTILNKQDNFFPNKEMSDTEQCSKDNKTFLSSNLSSFDCLSNFVTLSNFKKSLTDCKLCPAIVNQTPRDFFFIRILGEGSFSTVYFAKEVNTGNQYAIKVLTKEQIKREKKARYVLREKNVLTRLTHVYGGHAFIVKLHCFFQDVHRLYFVMSYAVNGELLIWLQRLGLFDEKVTLFYASEILAALEYLHNCKIIHRDLKPENILLGADWHILLSDFGTAKILDSEENYTDDLILENDTDTTQTKHRNSFVGTAQYVSPEVLKNSGSIGPECDYWALGAIIYQMTTGQPPFRAANEYQIMRKIVNLNYVFPQNIWPNTKDLIQKLLVYRHERLGSEETGGIAAIKNHPYFHSVDWENLPKTTPPELKFYLLECSDKLDNNSDVQLTKNLEPGLNDAAISRLIALNHLFEEINFNALNEAKKNEETQRQVEIEQKRLEIAKLRAEILETQRKSHEYHRFVKNNIILKWGPIDKKKGLFSRRRIFLLTEGPRLFYVDPYNMELKGEIPFSPDIRTEALNFRTFFVHTPKRTYYLFDPCCGALEWCKKINEIVKLYFNVKIKT